jgi:glycogen debranching enzyme
VAEVADAEPPHAPGGCPFQAWSLGELIRVERMLAPAATNAPGRAGKETVHGE